MNKLRWLVAAATVLLCTTPTRAEGPSIVTGGGTGTFCADLDGDGDIDGSHFGFAALKGPGVSARGHFMCQMAGNKDFLGLKLMLVEGRVSSAFFTPASVTFFGPNAALPTYQAALRIDERDMMRRPMAVRPTCDRGSSVRGRYVAHSRCQV